MGSCFSDKVVDGIEVGARREVFDREAFRGSELEGDTLDAPGFVI